MLLQSRVYFIAVLWNMVVKLEKLQMKGLEKLAHFNTLMKLLIGGLAIQFFQSQFFLGVSFFSKFFFECWF